MTAQKQSEEGTGHGRRFWVNLLLTTAVALAAWMWFNVHVKPHMSERLFGGITIAAGFAFAAGIVKMFVGKAAEESAQTRMHSPELTSKLLVAVPVIALAYFTTSTIYFVAGKKPADGKPLVVEVTHGSEVKPVELTARRAEAAMTFPFTMKPVSLQIAADGYRAKPVTFRYFTEETVPDPAFATSVHLLRISPGRNLFGMFGRTSDYRLRVLRNGRHFYDQPFSTFETLYLGGPEAETNARHGDAEHLRQMREYMRALDATMPEAAVQTWIDRWIDAKSTAATPALGDGDDVHVMLLAGGGKVFEKRLRLDPRKTVHPVFLEKEPTP